jgi:hypothetical protein
MLNVTLVLTLGIKHMFSTISGFKISKIGLSAPYKHCAHFLVFPFHLPTADGCKKSPRNLTTQEIGIVKIPGFSEWFLNHFIMKEPADNGSLDSQSNCQKTIIFAHHLKVLDGVQVNSEVSFLYFFCEFIMLCFSRLTIES